MYCPIYSYHTPIHILVYIHMHAVCCNVYGSYHTNVPMYGSNSNRTESNVYGVGYTLSYSSEMQMAGVSVLISPTASNILIRKRCGCSGDVFRCHCPEDVKCLVKLSDFDSVKTFQRKEFPGWHQEWWPYVQMSPEECEQVMGTPGYRAPEVCRLLNLDQHATQLGVQYWSNMSVCLLTRFLQPHSTRLLCRWHT